MAPLYSAVLFPKSTLPRACRPPATEPSRGPHLRGPASSAAPGMSRSDPRHSPYWPPDGGLCWRLWRVRGVVCPERRPPAAPQGLRLPRCPSAAGRQPSAPALTPSPLLSAYSELNKPLIKASNLGFPSSLPALPTFPAAFTKPWGLRGAAARADPPSPPPPGFPARRGDSPGRSRYLKGQTVVVN